LDCSTSSETQTFSKEFDSVLIVSGKADETNPHIEAALGWFFGYSLTPTVLLFTRKSILIYTS
jgi:nucleosome binding factor SPN SPT16 subunit